MFVLVIWAENSDEFEYISEVSLVSSDKDKLESCAENFKTYRYEKNRLYSRIESSGYIHFPEFIESEKNKKNLKIELDFYNLKNDTRSIKIIETLYQIELGKQKAIIKKYKEDCKAEYDNFCSINNIPKVFQNYHSLNLNYEILEVEEI